MKIKQTVTDIAWWTAMWVIFVPFVLIGTAIENACRRDHV